MIKAIFAIDEAGAVGIDGHLPWPNNATDLKHFQSKTLGSTVIMGRKTWEGLPENVRPFADRTNLVISKQKKYKAKGAIVLHPLQLAEYLNKKGHQQDFFVIGGAQLILSLVHKIEYIYMTVIEGRYPADTYLDVELLLQHFHLISSNHVNNCIFREYTA